MKLTIVTFGLFAMLMGANASAAKPAPKPVAKKAPVKTIARTAPRPVAHTATKKAAHPAAKPASKSAAHATARTTAHSTAKTSAHATTKGAPARPGTRTAAQTQKAPNRAPAHAAVPAKPAAGKPSSAPAQDVRGLTSTLRSMQSTPAESRMMRGPGSSHEIGEAMRVTGQSRNLSMGLLFSKDSDKIEFGNPRLHYKDKITSKQANY